MKNLITILLIMMGCSTKKGTTETVETNAKTERTAQLIKDGYIQAVVEDKTKSGCGFVIKNITTEEFLLPNNLEDEHKQDGLKVWLKYRPIRSAQGSCTIGNPITIEEIKIIE